MSGATVDEYLSSISLEPQRSKRPGNVKKLLAAVDDGANGFESEPAALKPTVGHDLHQISEGDGPLFLKPQRDRWPFDTLS